MDVNEALELANGSALPWAPVLAAEVQKLRDDVVRLSAQHGAAAALDDVMFAAVRELRAKLARFGPLPLEAAFWTDDGEPEQLMFRRGDDSLIVLTRERGREPS